MSKLLSFISPIFYRNCFNVRTSNSLTKCTVRWKSGNAGEKLDAAQKLKIRSTLYYVTAAGVMFVGMTYAAVPLYRMFCQVCLSTFFWFLSRLTNII